MDFHFRKSTSVNLWFRAELTDEDEGHRYDEGQDVTTDWLIVLAVSFGEEVESFVNVVFAQSLRRKRRLNQRSSRFYIFTQPRSNKPTRLEDFGGANEGGQSRRESGREGSCDDERSKPRHHGHHLDQGIRTMH